MENPPLRLFFALPIPGPVQEALEGWRRDQPPLRAPHVTLAFHGRRGTRGRAGVGKAGVGLRRAPFRPHLTPARFHPPLRLDALEAPAARAFQGESLVLFESRPGAGYCPLATCPLRLRLPNQTL